MKQNDPRLPKAPVKRGRPKPSREHPTPWGGRAEGLPVAPAAEPGPQCPPVDSPGNSPADQGAGPFQGLPSGLVERRLIRRAEALWDEGCPEGGLPPAAALAGFSAPAFADNSILFAAGPGANGGGPGLRLLRIGQALGALISGGRSVGQPPVPLALRLADLAAQGLASGRPAMLDIEPGGAPEVVREPDLLLRAIALPFAPPQPALAGAAPDVKGEVLVVVSWRQLLSAEETRALHRELADALERLRKPN